jgi:hypothetical protein
LEKKEYEQIEGKITAQEEVIALLNRQLENIEITQDPQRLQELCTSISLEETKLEQLFLRWQELDKKQQEG